MFCHCRTSLGSAQHRHPDQRHHAQSGVERALGQRRQNRPELLRDMLCVQVTEGAVPLLRRQRQLSARAARPAGSQGGGVGPAASHHIHFHNPDAQRGVSGQRKRPWQ